MEREITVSVHAGTPYPPARGVNFYRTSRPVTERPMISRWISEVPSKIVKIVERQPVYAGRWRDAGRGVSTDPARRFVRLLRVQAGNEDGTVVITERERLPCTARCEAPADYERQLAQSCHFCTLVSVAATTASRA
jgi:hypothetical protein